MSREQRTDGDRRRRQGGFSMIETLTAAALVGVMAMIAMPRIPRMIGVYDVSNTASQIALDIRLARERAITTNAKARLQLTSTNYTPQRESPAGSNTFVSDGAVTNLPNGVTVTTNPDTPTFDSRGLTTAAYTVTITNSYGDTKTITVTTIGRINVG